MTSIPASAETEKPAPPERSEKPALGRNIALPHAERLCELLRPVCARVEIAGSLRRGKAAVGDIEIVALPLPQSAPSLFHDEPQEWRPCEEFSGLLRDLQRSRTSVRSAPGLLRPDPANLKDGPRYKRFLLSELTGPGFPQGFGCDLFIADPDNWGNTLAIRTGSAAFSKFLMTRAWSLKRRRQQGGYLWQCLPGDSYDAPIVGRERIPCRDELAYFEAVGVPYTEPHRRDEAEIERIRETERIRKAGL